MFRDKDEELARLEEELLEKDTPQEVSEEDSDDEEEEYESFDGRLRAYNGDAADVDLEDFSDAVYTPTHNRHTGLFALLFLLLCGIFCVLAWWILRYKGVL